MQNFIVRITQENNNLLNNAEIGCFILSDTTSSKFVETSVAVAHAAGKLVLAEGEKALDFYLQYNTDGLILNTAKADKPQKLIKEVQKKAPKAVLGVVTRNRRHEAMIVSECEPDFVIFKFWKDGFESNKELLDWYGELFLIQNAAQIEDDYDFSALNADFIILDDVKYLRM
jgi:hypothetical protein